MQRITVSLPDEDAEALRALAASSCTTMSGAVRSLIARTPIPDAGSAPSEDTWPGEPHDCGVSLPLSDREAAVLRSAAEACGMDAAAYASRVIADCLSTGLEPAARLRGVWGHAAERAEVWVPLGADDMAALSQLGSDPAAAARALLAAAHTGHPFREDLRLSAPEHLRLGAAAAAAGTTKVAYLRNLVGQVRVRPVSVVVDIGELRAARADLKRTGSSVNQLARLANSGALVDPADAADTLAAYRAACARLERAVGGGCR